MLGSLLRPKPRRGQTDSALFSAPFTPTENSPWSHPNSRHSSGRVPRSGHSSDEDGPELQDIDEDVDEDVDTEWIREDEGEEEDGPLESTPLLPIFSASHLGMVFATMCCFGD